MFNISVKNTAEGRKLTLTIHGDIVTNEYWNDEAGEDRVRSELASMDLTESDTLTVSINSRGGDYFAGVSMYNTLKELPCKVITKNMALCASAATLPFMAGDERVCMAGSSFMIHDPLTGAYGNADELQKVVDTLNEICESAKALYLAEGVNSEALVSLMKSETMMTPKQALENGFATSINDSMQVMNSLSDEYINKGKELAISNFKKAPAPKQEPVKNAASVDFIVNSLMQNNAMDMMSDFYNKDFTECEINATISSMVAVRNICAASGVKFENVKSEIGNTEKLIQAIINEVRAIDEQELEGNPIENKFSIQPITGC